MYKILIGIGICDNFSSNYGRKLEVRLNVLNNLYFKKQFVFKYIFFKFYFGTDMVISGFLLIFFPLYQLFMFPVQIPARYIGNANGLQNINPWK